MESNKFFFRGSGGEKTGDSKTQHPQIIAGSPAIS